MKGRFLVSASLIVLFAFSAFAQEAHIVVTAREANIRAAPSTKSKIVGKVYKDAVLSVSANQGSWYYFVNRNIRGWIHSSVVAKADSNLTKPSASTKSSDWVEVANADGKVDLEPSHIFSVKPDKIVHNDPLIEFWIDDTRILVRASADPELSHVMILFRADCAKRKLAYLRMIKRDKAGNVVSDEAYSGNVDSVIPESIGEKILEKVCELSKTPR